MTIIKIWQTQDGRKIPLSKLSIAHINAIIRHAKKREVPGCGLIYPSIVEKHTGELIEIMNKELERRKTIIRDRIK